MKMILVTLFDFCDPLDFAMVRWNLDKTQRALYLSGLYRWMKLIYVQ
jgi:hypothetical protein